MPRKAKNAKCGLLAPSIYTAGRTERRKVASGPEKAPVTHTYEITPCPKPRMVRSDKWRKRPCVMRYWAFCDHVRVERVELPLFGAKIVFRLPMPDSWSVSKRVKMDGQPHQQRPDLSNILKALEDACYGEDSAIWLYSGIAKYWGYKGAIEITY